MNSDELKTLLSDDTLLRTLISAQPKSDASDADRFTLLCMLARHLPPREKSLAERLLLALLFMSLIGQNTSEPQ